MSKEKEENLDLLEEQKNYLIRVLKENGCRITRQRLMLLDILLKEECTSCKDVYYHAVKQDSSIGSATVYRTIRLLEDVGAIDRKNMYQISPESDHKMPYLKITLSDHTIYALTEERHRELLEAGLSSRGYISDQKIEDITFPDR